MGPSLRSRRATVAWSNATPASRRTSGLGVSRPGACELGHGSAVGAVSRCSRIASAAVLALVLLGDNTSARSSYGTNAACGSSRRDRQHHHQAWQVFSTSPKALPSNAALQHRASSLQSHKAGLASAAESKRRARFQVGSTVASGSAVSPAHMYRVSRSRGLGQGQGQQVSFFDGSDAARDSLQSPRSAIGGDGRGYPERLSAYSQGPSSLQSATPSIAEELGAVSSVGVGPELPVLSEEDLTQLRAGQRVQKQTRNGGSGSGSVVVDVRADPDIVLGLISKYEDYAEMIDTVRQCEVFDEEEAGKRKVEVTVSRFRLHIRVVMSLLPERNMVQFELDPDCTKAGRAVLREATGFFYVESLPDRPGYSRVWMLAKVDVNRFVPGGIVDYASGRALPRASNWIKPTCEAAQRRKLRAVASGAAGA